MEKYKYNVIWIDDEWEKQNEFIDECREIHGINLKPFKTQRDGIYELTQNIDFWDAVILDAKMLNESVEEVPSVKGLSNAIKMLEKLSVRKKIPYFVHTGQPDLMDNNVFEDSFGKFYVKEKDDDRLIADIKMQIDKLPLAQIKSIYQDVFDALDCEAYNKTQNILSSILISMHFPAENPKLDSSEKYNPLRQIVEEIFSICIMKEIIPRECLTNGKPNLNQCSIYLVGKNPTYAKVRYGNEGDCIVPKDIGNILHNVLNFGNENSHSSNITLKMVGKEQDETNISVSKYMLYGLTLQLCEVILWFRDFFNKLKRGEIVLKSPTPIDPTCIIEQDKEGNVHCGDILLSYKHSKDIGAKAEVIELEQNSKPLTKEKYPMFAKKVKIVKE